MKKIFILLSLFFYSVCAFAQVEARLKDFIIFEQQPFQLELIGSSVSTKPNFSALNKDFNILGEAVEQSVSYVNGRSFLEQKIILTLQAKQTGILTIPSLVWDGQKTKELQIEVKPAGEKIKIKEQTAVFIEAKPLITKVYEGAGLLYRVQLFERLGLFDVRFIPPYLTNAQIVPLGNYRLSQQEKDGILYQVFTQDYVIFPSKTGKVSIEPASFKAVYRKQGKNQPFGFMDSIIFQPNGYEEVIVRAKPYEIDVLPRPAEGLKQWWLPSPEVSLTQEWTDTQNVKVGQPITRQIHLKALNVLGNMLPDIEIQSTEDFKVYAEDVQKEQTYEETIGLIGTENRTFVFVPLKSGELILPEVSVRWFDTSSDTFKQAILPSKTINVLDNPQIKTKDTQNAPPLVQEQKNDVVSAQKQLLIQENNKLYFVSGLSVGLIFSLFILFIVFFKRAKKNKLAQLYPQNK